MIEWKIGEIKIARDVGDDRSEQTDQSIAGYENVSGDFVLFNIHVRTVFTNVQNPYRTVTLLVVHEYVRLPHFGDGHVHAGDVVVVGWIPCQILVAPILPIPICYMLGSNIIRLPSPANSRW